MPSSRTALSGTWSTGNFDTSEFLALKYEYGVGAIDADYYGGKEFSMYYFFKINNAMKGKLYLVDMSNENQNERIKEHLFKPME